MKDFSVMFSFFCLLDILEASIQFIQAVKLYDSNSNLLITVLNSLLTDYQDTSLAIELLK